MAGGYESFGGNVGFASWGSTVLDQVLPVECTLEYSQGGTNVIDDYADEFMRSVPWDTYNRYAYFCGFNRLVTKQEAHQLSHLVSPGYEDPGWVWWDVGEGRVFASAGGFRGVSGWCQFYQWEHYPDFVLNLQYFLAGLSPPSDLELLYKTRARFRDLQAQKQTLTATIDFIGKFNADTRRVDEKYSEALETMGEAKQHFVDLDLEKSKEVADLAFDQFEEAYDVALQAKNAAMLWIFLTEWLVVSSVSLICAFVIWSLMVRRRLYREVKVTRGGLRIA
jgi:hypothetical protein